MITLGHVTHLGFSEEVGVYIKVWGNMGEVVCRQLQLETMWRENQVCVQLETMWRENQVCVHFRRNTLLFVHKAWMKKKIWHK